MFRVLKYNLTSRQNCTAGLGHREREIKGRKPELLSEKRCPCQQRIKSSPVGSLGVRWSWLMAYGLVLWVGQQGRRQCQLGWSWRVCQPLWPGDGHSPVSNPQVKGLGSQVGPGICMHFTDANSRWWHGGTCVRILGTEVGYSTGQMSPI